jgi:hypothetical protein
MDAVLRSVKPLPDYRLELEFQNGSTALINMEQRVRTLRFACLAAAQVFATARAEGDKVVWQDGGTPFAVYCGELLDAMLLD